MTLLAALVEMARSRASLVGDDIPLFLYLKTDGFSEELRTHGAAWMGVLRRTLLCNRYIAKNVLFFLQAVFSSPLAIFLEDLLDGSHSNIRIECF